ncbi:hypothetical protein [Paraburkholderia bannensis]|uniref:hypothetical protein n=1 Tax=Paraburkholderia bannensis TaxID=765414 RepID=UPI002AC344EF|nr:hypothetical protein [Paraburkholderia bannensis]
MTGVVGQATQSAAMPGSSKNAHASQAHVRFFRLRLMRWLRVRFQFRIGNFCRAFDALSLSRECGPALAPLHLFTSL